jgi:hypothetical protein
MKMDMSGAAAVLSTMSALKALKCRTKVTAWLMCTDNMPSGSALKLGDVLTMRNGKTVEIHNTDAEGRLVLADGLSLAVEEEPDAIVDIATLTGAVLSALGPEIAGVLGTNQALVDQLKERRGDRRAGVAAAARDEALPQAARFGRGRHANIGGPYGGTITASIFLSEFTGDVPWAHLDIAGPMKVDGDEGIYSKGATGFGTRLLIEGPAPVVGAVAQALLDVRRRRHPRARHAVGRPRGPRRGRAGDADADHGPRPGRRPEGDGAPGADARTRRSGGATSATSRTTSARSPRSTTTSAGLLDWLDANDLAENTIVVYTSDQGFFLGDHGWFDKRMMYEESVAMPLLVRYPAMVEPGSVCDDIALNVDFAPTLLDLAGVDVPAEMQGTFVRPTARGRASPDDWQESMYYRYWMHDDGIHRVPAHYGVRTRTHKLICYYNDPLDQPGARRSLHDPGVGAVRPRRRPCRAAQRDRRPGVPRGGDRAEDGTGAPPGRGRRPTPCTGGRRPGRTARRTRLTRPPPLRSGVITPGRTAVVR